MRQRRKKRPKAKRPQEPAERKQARGMAGESDELERSKKKGDDKVEEASLESFPASDAPSY